MSRSQEQEDVYFGRQLAVALASLLIVMVVVLVLGVDRLGPWASVIVFGTLAVLFGALAWAGDR